MDFFEMVIAPMIGFIVLFPPMMLLFWWWLSVCIGFGHSMGLL